MMSSENTIQLMIYLAPLLASLMCCSVLAEYRSHYAEPSERKPLMIMILVYIAAAISWTCGILYVFATDFYIYIHPVFYVVTPLSTVMFHHLVFTITKTAGRKKFPRIHYLILAVLFGVLVVWSGFVPLDVQLSNLRDRTVQPGYEWFTRFQTSALKVYFIYKIIYPLLNLYYINRYRKFIGDYSADGGRTSVQWLYLLFYISIGTLPIAVAPLIFPEQQLIESLYFFIPILVSLFKDVVICSNMITSNYVIISDDDENTESEQDYEEPPVQSAILRLENYMNEQKPFLNSKLKITDLHPRLQMRRATLSALINQTYNMNFTGYVNSYRLRELEVLSNDPEFADLSKMELAAKAGFGNYRGYLRFKKAAEEHKRQLIK